MLDEIKVNSLRDFALDHLPATKALSKKLYLEHKDSRAALQVVATAPTLLINSPLSTTVEKLAGRLLHLVGEHPDTHTESLIDCPVGGKALGITLEDAIRYAEQKRAPIEAALIETARSLSEISGALLPPWMNLHNEQFASAQTATPALLAALGTQRGYVLMLPYGQTHVQFGELAHLIADAIWPDAGADDSRMSYGLSRASLDGELVQAVKAGTLQVKDPLTFGPHTFPMGNALLSALVAVNDLREFVAGRGLTVETAKAQATTTGFAPVVTDQTKSLEPASDGPAKPAAPAWSVKTSIKRWPGYRLPLCKFLQAAYVAGELCPKAQDVLNAWKLAPPQRLRVIASYRHDELEFELDHGQKKTADLKAIQAAINALII